MPPDSHDDVTSTLTRLLAGSVVDEGVDEPLDARWSRVRASSGLLLEVMSPRGAGGTIQRFLDRTGGGLHQVSFDADDIEACRQAASARDVPCRGERRPRWLG